MRTVVLGAGGQLGHDLQRVLADWDLIPYRRADLDICDYPSITQALTQSRPEVVINAAAYVRVDEAEAQIEEAFRVNAFAVRNLAQVCAQIDCVLVHISTDYVFGGEKRTPYTEDDPPNPLNVYGVSKLAGEYFVRSMCPRHFVIRSSGLYGLAGSSGKAGNFVETMLRLAGEGRPIRVVNDQVLTPTYTMDLARKIKELVKTEAFGLYHITNSGECSWNEFACKIFELSGLEPDLLSATSKELGLEAERPAYSVLGCRGLERVGLQHLSHWGDALREYLVERVGG